VLYYSSIDNKIGGFNAKRGLKGEKGGLEKQSQSLQNMNILNGCQSKTYETMLRNDEQNHPKANPIKASCGRPEPKMSDSHVQKPCSSAGPKLNCIKT